MPPARAKRRVRPDAARARALERWARYRSELAAAEERAKACLEQAVFARGRDRLWSVKSEIGGRRIRKTGFRTKTGAKLWLREGAQAFVRARKAKALSALPKKDRTIAKAFDTEILFGVGLTKA